MKSRFAVVAALIALALPLAAQGGPPAGTRGPSMMTAVPNVDTLTAQLALTDAQKPRVAAAVAAFEVASKDAREFMTKAQAGGNMMSMREDPDFQKHMTALREARVKLATDVKAAVSPEQAAKYDELYPQRMGRRPGGQ